MPSSTSDVNPTSTRALKPAPTARGFLLGLAIAIAVGPFFAYDLWEAILNAIEVPKLYAQLESVGLGAGEVPWLPIWIGIALPPLAYFAALLIGLRRNVSAKALIYLLGLVAVAALSMSINALAVAV